MDNDKGNSEDNSNVKSGSSTTVRNSLVTKRKTERKRRSSSSDVTSSDSDSSPHRKRRKKTKKLKKRKKSKKMKKEKRKGSSSSDEDERKREKRSKKKCKKKSNDKEKSGGKDEAVSDFGPAVPEEIVAKSKTMAPMSKDEWEKRQSSIKRVYDEDSGRYRLVKGDGEILEECVSRDRHKEINKQATAADGLYFQKQLKRK